MPGTPGTLSVESPISACTSMTFSGGTPNFSITSARPIFLSFMVSKQDDAVVDELHQVLVRGDDGGGGAGRAGFAHIGRDQVVGLEAVLLEARQIERLHRFADELELRLEIVGRIGPVRLVVGIHGGAEGLLRLVEDHRQMGRPLLRLEIAEKLPQHVAEAEHGIELQPVRFAVDRRQRVIGAKNVAGTVDQKDVVALLQRLGGGGRLGDFCAAGMMTRNI